MALEGLKETCNLRGSMEEIIRLALKLGEDHEGWYDRSVMQKLIS